MKLLLLAAALSACAAQTREVSASIGYAGTGDDEGSLGKGIAGGFAIGYRTSGRWGFEADYGVSRNYRDNIGGREYRGVAHAVLGNALVHFSKSRAQPYLLVGAGLMNYSSGGRSGTGAAGALGFGVKGMLTDRLFIRPEVRLTVGVTGGLKTAIEAPASVARFTMGIGYRW